MRSSNSKLREEQIKLSGNVRRLNPAYGNHSLQSLVISLSALLTVSMLLFVIVTGAELVSMVPWVVLVLAMVVGTWSLRHLRAQRFDYRNRSTILPAIIGFSIIPIVVVPVLTQTSGQTRSKLSNSGIVRAYDLDSNLAPILILSASVLLAATGAMVGGKIGGSKIRTSFGFGQSFLAQNKERVRLTHSVFLVAGLLGAVVSRFVGVGSVAERGTVQGAGVTVMIGWCLPLAIAMGFSYRHFGDRWRLVASFVGLGLLVSGDVRSPILLVFIGIVVGAVFPIQVDGIPTSRWSEKTRTAVLLFAAVSTALVSAFISSWRGVRIRNEDKSVWGVANDVLGDPLNYIALSGLDSYDGIRLAIAAAKANYESSIFDPLKGVVNLIPRSIYPDKEAWLGNELTLKMLGWQKGGIFLSGVGYFLVLSGSIVVALAIIWVIGAILGFIESRAGTNMMAVTLTAYFAVRFLMGGDAFDIQHVLMLAIACFIVGAVSRVVYAVAQTGEYRFTMKGAL